LGFANRTSSLTTESRENPNSNFTQPVPKFPYGEMCCSMLFGGRRPELLPSSGTGSGKACCYEEILCVYGASCEEIYSPLPRPSNGRVNNLRRFSMVAENGGVWLPEPSQESLAVLPRCAPK
jgi:hypothetical protein